MVTLNNVHSVAFYNVRNVASMTHTPIHTQRCSAKTTFSTSSYFHSLLLQAHAVAEAVESINCATICRVVRR